VKQPGAGAAAFSADWLKLREPFDVAARAEQPQLNAQLARWRASRTDEALAVLDLACGLGANLRVLAPRLGGLQRWRLVDHDPALLAALPSALQGWTRAQGYCYTADGTGSACRIDGRDFSASISWQRLDLSRDLASLDLARTQLVSASALLDLVSAAWLQHLVERACTAGAALLWALSVDGRMSWMPTDVDDAAVQASFEQHQQRDKGFGPALGPLAPAFALEQLAQAGYRSTVARSDWHAADGQGLPMQRALIDGIAAAALEQEPSLRRRVHGWRDRRRAAVERSRVLVGHVDVFAMPR
jgi:SAM-dependent methyltransferase